MGCGVVWGMDGWSALAIHYFTSTPLDAIATTQTVMYVNASGRPIGFGIQVMGELIAYVACK